MRAAALLAFPLALVALDACGGDDSGGNAATGGVTGAGGAAGGATSSSTGTSSTTAASTGGSSASSGTGGAMTGGGGTSSTGGSGGSGGAGGLGGGSGEPSPLWSTTYDYMNGNDGGNAVAGDATGNVFVAGYRSAAGELQDILLQKYDAAGAFGWGRYNNGAANAEDEGMGVAVDPATGHIVFASWTTSALATFSSHVHMYDAAGNSLWSSIGDMAHANAVAIGAGSSVIVAGDDASGELVLIKLQGSDGTLVWKKTIASPTAAGNAVAVDTSGNISVGCTHVNVDGTTALFVIAFDPNGNSGALWSLGDQFSSYAATGIAFDANQNVIVTGWLQTAQGTSAMVNAYSLAGSLLWARTFQGGDTALLNQANAVHVDGAGNVVVAGNLSTGGVQNIWFARLDATTGATISSSTLPSLGGGAARGVTTTASGNIILTGEIASGMGGIDVWLAAYPP